MTTFDRSALLALPVRQPNEMRAKTVGEYLFIINKFLLNNIDQVVNYMFVDTPITWQNEVGYAFVDAGIISLDKDYTIPIPEEEANHEIIVYLLESAFSSPEIPGRVWTAEDKVEEELPEETIELSYQDILNIPLVDTESATTIGEFYLGMLPQIGLDEESGFSTYRPYGNSGWSETIFDALDEAGLLSEDDGWPEAEAIIQKALEELRAAYSAKEGN